MVDLLWSFFICLTNSATMSKVLHTAYVFKCHPADVWLWLDGVRPLTFTVHIKCVVIYHLHFPGHLAIYFHLFCFLSSMFLRSSTNTLIFSFFLPCFLLSFGIFNPTRLSVSYIQRAEERNIWFLSQSSVCFSLVLWWVSVVTHQLKCTDSSLIMF